MKLKLLSVYKSAVKENWIKGMCPICKLPVAYIYHTNKDSSYIVCARCGYYEITRRAQEVLKGYEYKICIILSSYLRRLYEDKEDNTPLLIEESNIENLMEQAQASIPKHSEKFDLLLDAVERLQKYTGERINLEKPEMERLRIFFALYFHAMTYSQNDDELYYLFANSPYINISSQTLKGMPLSISLKPDGYKRLEEIRKQKPQTNKVFIIMAFNEEDEEIYEAIKYVLEQLGYKAVRADKEHYTGYIMDFILSEIKESKFVIAEISRKNLNVFFEWGYAFGYGIPVIPIFRAGKDFKAIEELPFDIKQYNTLIYENAEDLKRKLYERIRFLFGANRRTY